MTVTRPTAANRKILFNPDGKSMMFGTTAKGIVYDNVADTQDYICIRFPPVNYSGSGIYEKVDAAPLCGANFGEYEGGVFNFQSGGNPSLSWWDGTTSTSFGTTFAHLYQQWGDVHALDKGMFQPQTSGFPSRLRPDFSLDHGGFVRIPLNYFVGYGYDSIYCRISAMWWWFQDPLQEDPPDPPDPILSGTAYAWRDTGNATPSEVPPEGAVTKSISIPWLALADYQSSVPSGGGFVVSWDNEEDEISIT